MLMAETVIDDCDGDSGCDADAYDEDDARRQCL